MEVVQPHWEELLSHEQGGINQWQVNHRNLTVKERWLISLGVPHQHLTPQGLIVLVLLECLLKDEFSRESAVHSLSLSILVKKEKPTHQHP